MCCSASVIAERASRANATGPAPGSNKVASLVSAEGRFCRAVVLHAPLYMSVYLLKKMEGSLIQQPGLTCPRVCTQHLPEGKVVRVFWSTGIPARPMALVSIPDHGRGTEPPNGASGCVMTVDLDR